jgi:hypothetical protein
LRRFEERSQDASSEALTSAPATIALLGDCKAAIAAEESQAVADAVL